VTPWLCLRSISTNLSGRGLGNQDLADKKVFVYVIYQRYRDLEVGRGPLFYLAEGRDMGVKEEIEKRVTELVEPVLEEEGLELYDVEWNPGRKHSYLKVYINKEGGVDLGDCEKVSLQIGDLLDVENLITTRYFLEVSSPGLTRELKKRDHYRKSLGSLAKVVLKGGKGKGKTLLGTLVAADDEGFTLMTEEGEVRVAYEEVARARLDFEGL